VFAFCVLCSTRLENNGKSHEIARL
jgi:hypothetical protein